jgi:hypothetical protein
MFHPKGAGAKPQSLGHKAQRDSRELSNDYDLLRFPGYSVSPHAFVLHVKKMSTIR